MSSLFIFIYRLLKGKLVITLSVFLLCIVIMAFFVSKLELKEDVLQMLPEDKSLSSSFDLLKNSKFSDRIIINIASKDTNYIDQDALVEFTDVFAEQLLLKFKDEVKSLDYRTDDSLYREVLGIIGDNLPLFLDENDYLNLDTLLSQSEIRKKVENNFHTLTSPSGLALKEFILKDPLGLNYSIYQKLRGLQFDNNIELYDNHFITKDQKHLLLFLYLNSNSSETDKNALFFENLDKVIDSLTLQSNLKITYFGEAAVATANAVQIRKDSKLTSFFTIIVLVVLIIVVFRNFTTPFLIMIPVVFGALFGLTVLYFLKGGISIIAVGAGSIVLGIAVNYSLHFITHYIYHPNKEEVINDLSFPMIIGSTTTIGGFFCLQFLSIPVLRDLGLFAGFSLIGAAISTLIFLPHFISSSSENGKKISFDKFNLSIDWLSGNKYVILIVSLLTIVFYQFADDVKFEDNMMEINYMSPKLKQSEIEFNNFSKLYQKSLFVISENTSLNKVLATNEKILPQLEYLKEHGVITAFTCISDFMVSKEEQIKRIEKWNSYWNKDLKSEILTHLVTEGSKFYFKPEAFDGFTEQVTKEYHPLSQVDFNKLQTAIFNNLIDYRNGKYSTINIVKVENENTENAYKQLSKIAGAKVFSRQDVTNKLIKTVSKDFNFITIFTTLIVFLMLLLSYGRIELALIAFIPMVISWIWILGIMALLGIKFNIVNIILSTFVFALGDDFCIFTMDSLQQQYKIGKKISKSLRVSILLSAITTILGLGILIFAKHPALKSIALVSIIGIVSVWLMSQTLQPLLFNLIIGNQVKEKRFPITFLGFFKSLFAFSHFVFGALLLTIIGVILTKLIPFQKKWLKFQYHRILSVFVRSLVYIMANVKKNVINPHHENFSKPAVIIANHQSFLDILVLLMLHPKMIMLTNHWVWNSPVFGFVVRMADFQLAVNTDEKLTLIEEQVKDGYSIIIFPEGTRSQDCEIKRFHKGAFYLAEKLKLDIIPVVLHGTGYCMTKGEFLLKNGLMTIKVLERISPENLNFGEGYSQRTSKISKFFKNEYKILSEEVEDTQYFKDQLITNYLFKGPVLEWYMKVKIMLENNYKIYNEIIPKKNKILDVGCGYGFLAYMLSFTSKDREILGLDYDEEKINVAQHGFLKSQQLNFLYQDIINYQFENFDTIILSDVLHYLQPNEQETILSKCLNHISNDGMIIIRDGDGDLKERHKGTKLTELFSTKIIGFNKYTSQGLSFLNAKFLDDFALNNNLLITKIDNAKYTSNIFFILKKA